MWKKLSLIAAPLGAIIAFSFAVTDAGALFAEYRTTTHVTHTPVAAISTVPGGSSLFVVGTIGVIWTKYFDPRTGASGQTQPSSATPTLPPRTT